MSITRNTLALAGVCAVIGLGVEMRAQQPATPAGSPATAKEPGATTETPKKANARPADLPVVQPDPAPSAALKS